MTKKESLKQYGQKRDLGRTPEPRSTARKTAKKNIFVVQKHLSSHLHYDFRLEVEGVLKSWAIPKGPSTDPSEKRLAIQTEDHPMEYAGFEGVIPEGEYGAGAVIVWDRGTCRNLREKSGAEVPMGQCVEEGHLVFWLEGEKLKGGYSLTRFRREDKDQWLLVKMKDSEADPRRKPVETEPRSVLSGKTIEEIAG